VVQEREEAGGLARRERGDVERLRAARSTQLVAQLLERAREVASHFSACVRGAAAAARVRRTKVDEFAALFAY
jgi:hypothetical protein